MQSSTLHQDVYQELCKALRDGRLLPGQRISIRDLAAAVNTSPMPVREALRRLEAQGVLQAPPSRVLVVPGLSRAEMAEIYEIRITLEGLAAERAATRATKAEQRAVPALCAAMDRHFKAGDLRAFLDCNYEFHMAIYRAARMPVLMRCIEPLWLRISPFLFSLIEEPHLQFSMMLHWRAEEALRARDGAALRQAIESDIREASIRLAEFTR